MTIRSIRDHKQYKIAKIIEADLTKIIDRVTPIIKFLEGYRHYTPVRDLLNQHMMYLSLIKAHHTKYKKLVEETKPQ